MCTLQSRSVGYISSTAGACGTIKLKCFRFLCEGQEYWTKQPCRHAQCVLNEISGMCSPAQHGRGVRIRTASSVMLSTHRRGGLHPAQVSSDQAERSLNLQDKYQPAWNETTPHDII